LYKVVPLTEEWVSKGQSPLWGYIRGEIPYEELRYYVV